MQSKIVKNAQIVREESLTHKKLESSDKIRIANLVQMTKIKGGIIAC